MGKTAKKSVYTNSSKKHAPQKNGPAKMDKQKSTGKNEKKTHQKSGGCGKWFMLVLVSVSVAAVAVLYSNHDYRVKSLQLVNDVQKVILQKYEEDIKPLLNSGTKENQADKESRENDRKQKEEEQRKKLEEEMRKKEEKQRKKEEAEEKKRKEEERKKKEAEEEKRKEEELRQKKEAEEKKRKEEEERKKKETEEKKRKEEEERKKKEAEEKKKKKKEEEERKKKEAEDKKRKEEEERKQKEAEEKKMKEEEEQRKKKEAEDKKRKEEEERKKKEAEEKKRKEEEERKKKEAEEKKRKEEEERKKKEAEEMKRKEEEERKKKEAEEKKRKEEEERKMKEEEEKKRKEDDERKKKEAEEKKRKEAEEKKRKEEEQRKKKDAEEERKKDEEDQRLKDERQKKEAEERKRNEEEDIKKEEARRKREREDRRKEAEELRKKAEEDRKKKEAEEQRKKEEEQRLKEEQERRQKEEELTRKEDEKKKAEEKERLEAERKHVEEEKRKKEEEDKLQKQEKEENKIREEEKQKEEAKKQAKMDNEKNKEQSEDEVEERDEDVKPEGETMEGDDYEKITTTNQADYEIRNLLDEAESLINVKSDKEVLEKFEQILKKYPNSPRAHYQKAELLMRLAEEQRSNQLLEQGITEYQAVLDLKDVPDQLILGAGMKLAEKQAFRGWTSKAIKTWRFLADVFPYALVLKNKLGVSLLIAGKNEEAKKVFTQVLEVDPNEGFAKVHLGFILKTVDNDLETGIQLLSDGIASGVEGTQEPKFYFHLGDALQRLNKRGEAYQIYQKAVDKGLLLSIHQRSLYNVPGLLARPFWTPQETGYQQYIKLLEDNWETIRDEGLAQLNKGTNSFQPEAENLREKGDWKQFTLYQRGQKNKENCAKTPKTCELIDQIPPAKSNTRGQVKYSIIHPGTHIWPHCGPTNCRLRAHLGLKVPKGLTLRVWQTTRTWQEGKVMIFDDSFEHEVWHQGTEPRLVLIVDFWHPELTKEQQRTLAPI